jgi:N-acetyl-gamma-glutamyl-phosphate reductase
MIKVFIDGREGTTGLRIEERLAGLEVALLALPEEERKNPAARREMLGKADVAFLCLPDAAAKESVSLAAGSGVRLIDASTAHRTQPGWAYGFPELSAAHRAAIASGNRVAVPGCHASGFIALVYPLVRAGVLPKDSFLTCYSLTGYTGGGKSMIADYEAPDRPAALKSPRLYALAQTHKHLPEMTAVTGLHTPPVFVPVVADFARGMLVTVPIFGAQVNRARPEALLDIYQTHYAGSAAVSVQEEADDSAFWAANACAGKDGMRLFVRGGAERMTLLACFDNLGKGASGAAVQCLNLMLGWPEARGLSL